MSYSRMIWSCSHGKTLKEDCQQCETIWSRSFMTAEQRGMADFYNVNTKDELIAAQAHHIEKLQSRLPPRIDEQPGRVREG